MNRALKCAALCAALATVAGPASAAVQLRITDGTPAGTIMVSDQGVGDSNPDVGVVTYSGPVGTQWVVNFTTATSKPQIGSATSPEIDLNSINASSTSGGFLTVEITDTDFTGSGPSTISIGGATSGTVMLKSYVDYGNAPFGKTTLLANQGPFSGGSFANNASGPFITPGVYSMTLALEINHVGSARTGLDAHLYVTTPAVSCPTNATVRCGGSLDPDVNTALGKPVYTGAASCGAFVTMTYSDAITETAPCAKTILRTWTIADGCDVTNYCTQVITVQEDVAPILTVPANMTVECNGIPPVGIATGSDNCDPNVVVEYLGQTRVDGQNPACSYSLVRTWKATDSCGNAVTNSQNILVQDTTAPVLTVPPSLTVECSAVPAVGNASATDNCSANPVVTYLGAITNGSGCNYTITRKWKAADTCGNAVTNSQLLTVRDTTPPVITCPPDGTVTTNSTPMNTNKYCSFTQGGWGAPPSGNNPGKLLRNNFSAVYPSGLCEIGLPGSTGYSIKFTSSSAIQAFLPSGGTPGVLNADLVNPVSSSAGVFGGQVLALKLNVDFSSYFSGGAAISFGDLVNNDPSSPYFGRTVRSILALCNAAIGGSNTGYSYSSLSTIADTLNQSFDNCVANSWSRNLLGGGTTTSTNTGTATATDNCDPNPAVTYTDTSVPGACPGSLIITRTWKATDLCGNSNTCVQKITLSNCVSNPTPASVCGTVLRDCDANSSLTGESGLSGWTVTLKNATTLAVVATRTTDASGNYCFTNLVADSYCVVVTTMANYGQTVDPDTTLDSQTCFALATGQTKTGVNFGYTGTAPSVNIVMTGPATAKCGDTITYSICVTNTGNTCLYGGLEVQDPLLGGQIFHQTPVAPGQGFCFTRTYVVKTNDAGTLVNTATVLGYPPGELIAVSKTVTVSTTVTCTPSVSQGCTLTIGYYKNHPTAIAPLPVYLGTQGGAKTLVVSSQTIGVNVLGQHTYGVPDNGITKLYAQLLAAKLNGLSGASLTAAASAISAADAFLATHNQNDWATLTVTETANVLAWHTTLDRYNNGLIGPGHCGDRESDRALNLKSTTGNKSVKLVWTKSTEATSYKVLRGLTPNGPYNVLQSGLTGTNCTDIAVTNGVAYYYVISACKNGAEITDSDEACAIPTAGVTSPWLTKDIGVPGYTGGSSLASGVFTILGGGDDIWNTADKFRYTYQSGSGDCTVIGRVTALSNTDAWAKAGVMIRESLTPGSKHAFMCLTPDNGAAFQSRSATGGSSLSVNAAGLTAPYWVKVTRVGSKFTGYVSPNGTTWTKVGEQTITMTTGVYIGLAVTSHNDATLTTATFQNVTATP